MMDGRALPNVVEQDLIIGDIKDTIPSFMKTHNPPRLAQFCMIFATCHPPYLKLFEEVAAIIFCRDCS